MLSPPDGSASDEQASAGQTGAGADARITVGPAAIGVVATRLADALTTGDIVYIATDEQRGGKKWICFGAIILHRSILDAVDSLRSA